MITAQQLIDAIIVREGSTYTNNHLDRGGPTKYGITQATLAKYRNRPVTPEEVEALTEVQAREIYLSVYVAPFQIFPGMGDALLGLLADSAVQHGTGRAMQWLQSAVGAKADGDAGPATVACWKVADTAGVYKNVLKARIKFYAAIIHNDPTEATFANGWFARVCEFI